MGEGAQPVAVSHRHQDHYMPKHIHSVEKDATNNLELQYHPSRPACQFGDIEQFYSPSMKSAIRELRQTGQIISLQSLSPALRTGKSVRTYGMCLRHNKKCKLDRAGMNIAGLPCLSLSPRGLQDALDGECMVAWGAYFGLRRAIKERIIVLECSHRLKAHLVELEKVIGDIYLLEAVEMKPEDSWVARRPRLYIVGIYRQALLDKFCTLSDTVQLFSRYVEVSYRVLLVATERELDEELEWAIERRDSLARGMTLAQVKQLPSPFYAALTQREVDRHREYTC